MYKQMCLYITKALNLLPPPPSGVCGVLSSVHFYCTLYTVVGRAGYNQCYSM